jgi:hypothetical protein
MTEIKLGDDYIALLKLIREWGATVCAGTCEHSGPGELHCQRISNLLKISASGAKRRLRELTELGLLHWERAEREDGKVLGKWTLSPEGLKYLDDLPEKSQDSDTAMSRPNVDQPSTNQHEEVRNGHSGHDGTTQCSGGYV